MAGIPNYINLPSFGAVKLSAAVTWSSDQPTNATLLLTMPATPGMLLTVQVKGNPQVNSTLGQVYFWLYDGTTYYLVKEIVITAVTVAAGTPAFDSTPTSFGLNGQGWAMPGVALATANQWKLYCATKNAEICYVTAQAGSF